MPSSSQEDDARTKNKRATRDSPSTVYGSVRKLRMFGWKGVSFKSGTYSGIRGSLGHAVIVEFRSRICALLRATSQRRRGERRARIGRPRKGERREIHRSGRSNIHALIYIIAHGKQQ